MLKQNNQKHIQYEEKTKTISFHKSKIEHEDNLQEHFYKKLQMVDNIDVLRFVDKECEFLSAFTPIQPSYVKQLADNDGLFAVVTAQA